MSKLRWFFTSPHVSVVMGVLAGAVCVGLLVSYHEITDWYMIAGVLVLPALYVAVALHQIWNGE